MERRSLPGARSHPRERLAQSSPVSHSFVGGGGSRMTTPREKSQKVGPFILFTPEKV